MTDQQTNNSNDAFEQELRSSAADVLSRCDSEIASGVVRAIRERSITSSVDEDAGSPLLGWFGWREVVGVAAVLTLAAGVWWSGFESGRAAEQIRAEQAQAVLQALPEVGDRTASSLRGVLAQANTPMGDQATELKQVSTQIARSIVEGIPVPGLWDRLTGSSEQTTITQ